MSTKEIITKKGQKMAFCKLEDHQGGEAEVVVFSDCYAECREYLAGDAPLFLTAKVGQSEQAEGEGKKLIKLQAVRIDPLAKIIGGSDEPVEVILSCPEAPPVPLDPLGDILRRYPGQCIVHLVLSLPRAVCRLRLGQEFGVRRCPELRRELDDFEHRVGAGGR